MQQRQTETTNRVNQQHTQQSQQSKQQLQSIRQIVEGICKHMDTFTNDEREHRKQHEAKLANVVGVLEKTFAEMMAE